LTRANAFKKHLREKYTVYRKNELERHLNEFVVNGDDKLNILDWWKINSSWFPILSRMVRDVLATPISTIAYESAFNTEGRVLDAFKICLNPSMVEALICAQNWLKTTMTKLDGINVNEEFELSEKIFTGTRFVYFPAQHYCIIMLFCTLIIVCLN